LSAIAAARVPGLVRTGLKAALALILLAHAARLVLFVGDALREGLGYASPRWRASPIMTAIDNLPPDATIYTNAPDVVAFVLGRCADYVPVKVSRFTGKPQPGNTLEMQMSAMDARLDREGAYVAFVDEIDWRFYLAEEGELIAAMGLDKILETPTGRIYARPAARGADPAPSIAWRPGFGGCTCEVINTRRWAQCR
jgi:hypothetical protein